MAHKVVAAIVNSGIVMLDVRRDSVCDCDQAQFRPAVVAPLLHIESEGSDVAVIAVEIQEVSGHLDGVVRAGFRLQNTSETPRRSTHFIALHF